MCESLFAATIGLPKASGLGNLTSSTRLLSAHSCIRAVPPVRSHFNSSCLLSMLFFQMDPEKDILTPLMRMDPGHRQFVANCLLLLDPKEIKACRLVCKGSCQKKTFFLGDLSQICLPTPGFL